MTKPADFQAFSFGGCQARIVDEMIRFTPFHTPLTTVLGTPPGYEEHGLRSDLLIQSDSEHCSRSAAKGCLYTLDTNIGLTVGDMETLKAVFFGPDPQAQMRKCNQLIRSNTRQLDRDIAQLKTLDTKTRQFILSASRRAERNPSQARQATVELKTFARELVRIRKQNARLTTSRAQLQSVQMQVNEAFSVRKIQGSLKKSTGIMKDVNTLVKLPELSGTMHQLSTELVRAGIIEEMVDDAITDPNMLEEEEEEADAEVDKILQEILQGKLSQAQKPEKPLEEEPAAEDVFEDQEATLEQMRGRLEALKS